MKSLRIAGALILVLAFWTLPSIQGALDRDDLDFRYWRNLKTGKAFKAALLAVDEPTGQIQLVLNDGKKFVVKVADYHAEDKEYVKEWVKWTAEEKKRAADRGSIRTGPGCGAHGHPASH